MGEIPFNEANVLLVDKVGDFVTFIGRVDRFGQALTLSYGSGSALFAYDRNELAQVAAKHETRIYYLDPSRRLRESRLRTGPLDALYDDLKKIERPVAPAPVQLRLPFERSSPLLS